MIELEKHETETRESVQEQIQKLNALGSVKEILQDKSRLLQIVTYFGDRHLIATFLELVNKEIKEGTLTAEDLFYLRSGWLGNAIIHLEDCVMPVGRKPYTFEKGDKLNYMTLIEDVETQVVTFTNPKIINVLAKKIENPGGELSYWEQSMGYLAIETQLKIVEEVIRAGNTEKGLQIIAELNNKMERIRKFEEEEKQQRGR